MVLVVVLVELTVAALVLGPLVTLVTPPSPVVPEVASAPVLPIAVAPPLPSVVPLFVAVSLATLVPPLVPLAVAASVAVLVPPTVMVPLVAPPAHCPTLQDWPSAQAVPHCPQFEGSLLTLTQVLPHRLSPTGQLHTPSTQLVPPLHWFWHAPQCSKLKVKSTQACPQGVTPGAQLPAHTPAEQNCPAGQTIPQPPQFCGFDAGSMQEPEQLLSPLGQAQLPA